MSFPLMSAVRAQRFRGIEVESRHFSIEAIGVARRTDRIGLEHSPLNHTFDETNLRSDVVPGTLPEKHFSRRADTQVSRRLDVPVS